MGRLVHKKNGWTEAYLIIEKKWVVLYTLLYIERKWVVLYTILYIERKLVEKMCTPQPHPKTYL